MANVDYQIGYAYKYGLEEFLKANSLATEMDFLLLEKERLEMSAIYYKSQIKNLREPLPEIRNNVEAEEYFNRQMYLKDINHLRFINNKIQNPSISNPYFVKDDKYFSMYDEAIKISNDHTIGIIERSTAVSSFQSDLLINRNKKEALEILDHHWANYKPNDAIEAIILYFNDSKTIEKEFLLLGGDLEFAKDSNTDPSKLLTKQNSIKGKGSEIQTGFEQYFLTEEGKRILPEIIEEFKGSKPQLFFSMIFALIELKLFVFTREDLTKQDSGFNQKVFYESVKGRFSLSFSYGSVSSNIMNFNSPLPKHSRLIDTSKEFINNLRKHKNE